MKKMLVELEIINPVIISEIGGDNNMLNTKAYIPGSTVLGVFAKNFIKNNKIYNDAHKNNDFKKLFLEDNVIFQNLYVKEKNNAYFPTPYSIRQEKNGYKIYDVLLNNEDFKKQTKALSFYSRIKDGNIYFTDVKKGISFHHARDRISGTSQKGIIFNYEYIKPNQTFSGVIIGDNSNIDKFYGKVDKEIYARIGRSRNSQYGKVKITLSEPEEYLKDLSINDLEEEDVVMTFLSDTIIYNRYGYSTTNIKDIEKALNIKIKKGYIKQGKNEQYVSVWRLQKPVENVIEAGSCLLLEKLPDNYNELEQKGIGERRNEGFGRVIFGYQKTDELKKIAVVENKKDAVKPDNPVPEFVKTLVKNIVKEKLIEKTKRKALRDAHDFKNLPSKSLLGKLQFFSKDIDKFAEKFKHVQEKDIAKSQLTASHNNTQTLLSFINNKLSSNFENILEGSEINLLNEVKLNKDIVANDKIYKMKLKAEYFITFFNFLRKNGGRK